MNKTVYVDHSATTFVKQDVLNEMLPYFSDFYGNASSLYKLGRESKKAIEIAREKIAKAINAKPNEIYFTGSGTEADNFAIKGICLANKNRGNHIITSQIEHPAVLNTCKYLEKNGFEVTYVPVDNEGIIDLEFLKNSVKNTTILISVMYANNEIGTIQPIDEIAKLAKEKNIYFHTDAVQALANLKIDVAAQNIDLMTISSHKFYGPKGIAILYVKSGVKIESFIHGGAQERNKRGGTENVPAIVGMGKAIELATNNIDQKTEKIKELRDYLTERILKEIPYTRLNGHKTKRLCNNINVSFEFIEGESLLMMLDMKGIYSSTGSACSSGSLDPSHVLLAIGLAHEIAHGSLRISLGEENTFEEMDYIMEHLPSIVEKLRQMSPLYENK